METTEPTHLSDATPLGYSGEQDDEQRDNHGERSGALPPQRKRQQRHLLACVGCRRIKTRCLGNEDQVSACQRCQRLKLECVYERKRRRKLVVASPEPVPIVPVPTFAYRMPNRGAKLPPLRRLAAAESVSGSSTSASASGTSGPAASPLSLMGPNPTPPNRVDIREYLDPALQIDSPDAAAVRREDSGVEEDPIRLQLVSLPEADHLHSLYMQHLHALIATLDPKLHTLAHLRSCPVLLSALLTVTAKYFLRRLYPSLLSHTRQIIDRAVGEGRHAIGLIQALILMVMWKEPNDSSSWVKLGIAIRLGYQLGMHVRRTEALPADESEARRIANVERTWYTLSSFDRLYSDIYSLPPTIRLEEIPDGTAWAEETAHLGCGDYRHACSFSSASTYRMWVQYRRMLPTMSRELAAEVLRDLYAQMDGHTQRWFPDDLTTGKITPFEQTYLKWFNLNHLSKIKYLMIDTCSAPSDQAAHILDWLLLADQFASQTAALGKWGTLRFLQDTSATHISAFGATVYNLFPRLSPAQKRLGIEHVRRVSRCCDKAVGEGESVMGFVARFMQRLVQVLDAAAGAENGLGPRRGTANGYGTVSGGGAESIAVTGPVVSAGPRRSAGGVAAPVSLSLLPSSTGTDLAPSLALGSDFTLQPSVTTPLVTHSVPALAMQPDLGAHLDLDDFFRSLLQNGPEAQANGIVGGGGGGNDAGWWFDPGVVLH